jgi:hypothetical protein
MTKVKIWNLDLEREEVELESGTCRMCGMVTNHPREFHPYAVCLMMMGARNGNVVQANLDALIRKSQASVKVDAR